MRFESLREKLLKAGIAPRHVRRYLRELDDHLADLIQAQGEAGYDEEVATARAHALLGGDSELAAAMLARPGFKSWAARWPWAVFGLAPPLVMPAAFFAAALPLVLIADLHGALHKGIAAPGWFQSLAWMTALFANLALGPGLVALLAAVAWRQRLNWKWPLLASALVAIAGLHMVARFSQYGSRSNHIEIGTLMDFSHGLGLTLPLAAPVLLAQFLLTLAPALWLLRMQRRQSA
jgi:uncharacterized membrane protein HdeD (DUF308 family)